MVSSHTRVPILTTITHYVFGMRLPFPHSLRFCTCLPYCAHPQVCTLWGCVFQSGRGDAQTRGKLGLSVSVSASDVSQCMQSSWRLSVSHPLPLTSPSPHSICRRFSDIYPTSLPDVRHAVLLFNLLVDPSRCLYRTGHSLSHLSAHPPTLPFPISETGSLTNLASLVRARMASSLSATVKQHIVMLLGRRPQV